MASKTGVPMNGPGDFHASEGVLFTRADNGDVVLYRDEPQGRQVVLRCDEGTWISVVLSVSAWGERPGDWSAMSAHHMGRMDVLAGHRGGYHQQVGPTLCDACGADITPQCQAAHEEAAEAAEVGDVAALKVIVDKTVDGVPVVHCERLWLNHQDYQYPIMFCEAEYDLRNHRWFVQHGPEEFPITRCYSTLETASVAKAANDPRPDPGKEIE